MYRCELRCTGELRCADPAPNLTPFICCVASKMHTCDLLLCHLNNNFGFKLSHRYAGLQRFIQFADLNYGGKIRLEDAIRYVSTFYNPSLTAHAHAINFALDKDGFISTSEFETILEILRIVYPNSKLPGKTFQQFVKEADSNNDGKVSIDECADWTTKFTAS